MADVDRHARPKQHRQPHRKSDQERPGYRRPYQSGDQLAGRKRRHQIIDDIPLDLADQQREARVGKGVLHHRHDDQARRDEIREGDAHDGSARTAQRDREDREI